MVSAGRQIAKGVTWLGALRLITHTIGFLKIAIIARILSPEQFGVFGIAALVMSLLELLTETGVNVFLIQEKSDIKKYINTAWSISVARGVFIFILLVLASPLIAGFFEAPEATQIITYIALVPLVRGLVNPNIVRFRKELEFSREFVLRFVIYVFDAGVSILLALITHSPSSMVWGLVAGSVAEVVISHLFIKPRPKVSFERVYARSIIGRGKWVTAGGVFDYLFTHGDDMVVGKLLGSYQLGLYQVAYKISTLPITEVADVFNKVAFPVFVKVSQDFDSLKRAYIKSTIVVTALVVPIGLIFFLFPSEILLIILGEKWVSAWEVLRVLSLFGVVRAIVTPNWSLYLAFKKQQFVAYTILVSMLGMGLTIIPLINSYGINGAGVSAIVGLLVSIPVFVFFTLNIWKQKRK